MKLATKLKLRVKLLFLDVIRSFELFQCLKDCSRHATGVLQFISRFGRMNLVATAFKTEIRKNE